MNSMITKAAGFVMDRAGIFGLKIRKASPEILLGVGAAGVIAGAVMACKATLKAEDILSEAEEAKKTIEKAKETAEEGEYTEEDEMKDRAVVIGRTAIKFAKLYGPSIAVFSTGLGLIFWSHGIMKGRQAALIASYNAVSEGYKLYRERVKDEVGEEKEKDIFAGLTSKKIEVEEPSDEGKGKKVKKEEKIFVPGRDVSMYAKFFDESSPEWMKNPEYNLQFLKCKQSIANDILHSRGYIFLNEVYDMLGLPMTQAGQLVGWIKGAGDDYVDFGLYNGYSEKVRDFINGYERSILLDFNVDGVIYDKI